MRYVAFLRAINVGGHTVRMEVLRSLFAAIGARDVQTFIASGNVIFEAPSEEDSARLEAKIESMLETALKFRVTTFLRTLPELARVSQFAAFPEEDMAAAAGFYVGFLKSPPPKPARDAAASASTASHRFRVQGRELYWLRVNRDEEFAGPKTENVLGPTTVRSITTVRKIAIKYGADAGAAAGKKKSDSRK